MFSKCVPGNLSYLVALDVYLLHICMYINLVTLQTSHFIASFLCLRFVDRGIGLQIWRVAAKCYTRPRTWLDFVNTVMNLRVQ
jgi:hypothetical protein